MVVILRLSKFLKNNENARKIFGKKELDIILKQIHGIYLTQSERNRLSRDIRPKLKFIKEINKYEDEFNLKKDSNSIKIINKAVKLILKDSMKDNVVAVILFGSHYRGVVTWRSDIDICVVFDKITPDDSMNFRLRILRDLPDKVDIQVFNILPQKIKRDIVRNYKILYKKQDFDNLLFSIRYLKDDDYFIRMKKIMGESA